MNTFMLLCQYVRCSLRKSHDDHALAYKVNVSQIRWGGGFNQNADFPVNYHW